MHYIILLLHEVHASQRIVPKQSILFNVFIRILFLYTITIERGVS